MFSLSLLFGSPVFRYPVPSLSPARCGWEEFIFLLSPLCPGLFSQSQKLETEHGPVIPSTKLALLLSGRVCSLAQNDSAGVQPPEEWHETAGAFRGDQITRAGGHVVTGVSTLRPQAPPPHEGAQETPPRRTQPAALPKSAGALMSDLQHPAL